MQATHYDSLNLLGQRVNAVATVLATQLEVGLLQNIYLK